MKNNVYHQNHKQYILVNVQVKYGINHIVKEENKKLYIVQQMKNLINIYLDKNNQKIYKNNNNKYIQEINQ